MPLWEGEGGGDGDGEKMGLRDGAEVAEREVGPGSRTCVRGFQKGALMPGCPSRNYLLGFPPLKNLHYKGMKMYVFYSKT